GNLKYSLQAGINLESRVWTQVTSSAAWSGRYNHTSVVFNNKIWVMGGYDGNGKNDVWYSGDGITWNEATPNAQWGVRAGHTNLVFGNKIWLIGGSGSSTNRFNDVWNSSNGINWTEITPSASWSKRTMHTSVVFNNKIWVIGGWGGQSDFRSDVWYSSDGVTWLESTSSAPWGGLHIHSSVVFDGKIWVIGGHMGGSGPHDQKNDVWYSTDGASWVEATSDAPWGERAGHASIVFDNKMWVIGGGTGIITSRQQKNDVWYSTNGSAWTELTSSAPWNTRAYPTSVVFNEKIWILGGWADTGGTERRNDVWSF
ncbi:hypothetical protein WDW89_12875, partial [Deltaproteobacteria bacterium TL4]